MGEVKGKSLALLRMFVLVNAIGIAVALGVWLYGQQIDAIVHLRLSLGHGLPRWLVLPAMGVLGGGAAGLLISFVEPAAKGSGIVEVLLFLGAGSGHGHRPGGRGARWLPGTGAGGGRLSGGPPPPDLPAAV